MTTFSDMHLYFDDVEVGQEWESQGRTITEADIVTFAGISGDYNPIHMDRVFAESTPFGQRIAHGMLVLSIASGLGSYSPPIRTLAFLGIREVNFLGPVYIGDTLRLRSTIIEIEERSRGRRANVTWRRQVVNQKEEIIQDGVTMTLVEGRANRRRTDALKKRIEERNAKMA